MSASSPMPLYDEVLALLEEAARRIEALPQASHAVTRIPEMSLLTSRLVAMMGWAMARRAVANGEFSDERARREFGLAAFNPIGEESAELQDGRFSADIAEMNGRALMLYRRIARLDARGSQNAGRCGPVAASPSKARGDG